MSKLNMDTLKESIKHMMTVDKKRKFLETVELQVLLKVKTNFLFLRITILKRTKDLWDLLSFLMFPDQS